MFKNLSPRAIGFSATLQSELIELALTYGFRSIDIDLVDFSEQVADYGLTHSQRLIESARLRIGNFELPFDLECSEERYKQELARIPELGKLAADLKNLAVEQLRQPAEEVCPRALTVLQPATDARPYEENFEFHRKRLGEIAEALAPHGVRLGVEFRGAATFREGKKHEFIHDLKSTLTLIQAVGAPNLGLVLDAWQWYASGGSLDEFKSIPVELLVSVQLSDCPPDVAREKLIATDRRFPSESSGAIDSVALLKILKEKGYKGPVTPEAVTKKSPKGMGREQAIRMAGETLESVWKTAGLVADAPIGPSTVRAAAAAAPPDETLEIPEEVEGVTEA